MVSWRLRAEVHGSDGFTSLSRLMLGFGFMGAVALASQLGFSSWYLGRMLPGTVVGDKNISGYTLPQARAAVLAMTAADKIDVSVAGRPFTLTPDQLGVSYDPDATVKAAYGASRTDWWRLPAKATLPLAYQVDTAKLTATVKQLAASVGTTPVDAAITITNGRVATVPEQSGQTVDRLSLARLIQSSLGTGEPAKLEVKPSIQLADVKVANLAPAVTTAKQLMASSIVLSYNGQTYTPSEAQIGSWLDFVKTTNNGIATLAPQLDQAQVAGYVQKIANQVNVAPVAQLVTDKDGVSTVNRPGANGIAIDQDPAVAAIMAAVSAGQPLTFTITDHPVPFLTVATNFTTLPYAKYVEINLSKQHAWVWENGNIIYDTPVTSGATGAGFGTVTGLFSIYYKATNTWLNGQEYGPRYAYNDFVKYWMPFYSGYGMHDASWRNGNFGETSGPLGYWYDGSHGCVNLPDAAAEFIYNWSDVGTPVWVHL